MFDHLTIGSHDLPAATAFYTECFKTLGVSLQNQSDQQTVYGKDGQWNYVIYPAAADAVLNGSKQHIAFSADSEEAVKAFYDTALALGGSSLRAPGGLLTVNERYFGAMCKDLDQHALEIVYWKPA